MDHNETPINIYIDLSKAFDTLDHEILLAKLQYYGIHGTPLELLKSYLTNRKQYVEIEDTKSKMLDISTGVPQCSILGPLLFIIYVNDFALSSEKFKFVMYADDTTLTSTLETFSNNELNGNPASSINIELNKISEWLKLNRLTLNVQKTKYMLFKTSKKKVKFVMYADDTTLTSTLETFSNNELNGNPASSINIELNKISEWLKLNRLTLNVQKTKYMLFKTSKKKVQTLLLQMDNKIIDKVLDFNFLGIHFNEQLNWKSHIDKLSVKCCRILGILNRLKRILPLNIKIILYNSLMLPHLNYGITLWGFKCERILKLQKKAARILSASKYNAHTEPLFKNLKLLKIEHILKLHELKLYYKFIHIRLPVYLQNFKLDQNSSIHNINTRGQHNIHTTRVQQEFAKHSLRYTLPRTINNTPNIILNKIYTHSLHGFATYIKNFFIQTYNIVPCTIINCYICQ